jgi:hypothetical protein
MAAQLCERPRPTLRGVCCLQRISMGESAGLSRASDLTIVHDHSLSRQDKSVPDPLRTILSVNRGTTATGGGFLDVRATRW